MIGYIKALLEPFITQKPHKTLAYYRYHLPRARYHLQHTAPQFDQIKGYCMFLGYPRSSHTLIGAMLDAHPNMVVAHELSVLELLPKADRNWIIARIIAQSEWFINKNNAQWTGYSYKIPNQWQGKFQELQVVGDKKGGVSTRILAQNPAVLDQLQQKLQLPIQLIHVVRNPFDVITTMASWNGEKRRTDITTTHLQQEINNFFMRVEAVDKVKKAQKYPLFDLYNEDLIANPTEILRQLCLFLHVTPTEDYLKDCASVVFSQSKKSRNAANWTAELSQQVQQKINQYDFLQRYNFDN
ncbi:MAG: sulfotransferase [Chitinophagales bacterium]|mgnify:CR=1 FL=1|nr:sulfotransferase [Chitinophagales bacterium]